MIRRLSHRFARRATRRGAVLLVVLGLLALFAVVGLGFVLYAESEATGARHYRESRSELADPDPTTAANGFLAQLVFGTSDPASPGFGHDLARSRFGPVGTQSPYTGTGVPGEPLTLSGRDTNGAAAPGLTLDRRQVVNFRAAAGWDPVSPDFLSDGTTRINKAVPWTYPDRNNFWLAYYDPATDTVTVPSFHRPDLFGPLDPTNVKWRNNGHASGGDSTGFYQTLRPRPAEHPAFHYPPANADGTYTGDVCNLRWLTGSARNDSVWLDLGLPVRTWRGKQYKTLVAPLILDLGGKVNLSVAGNSRGFGGVSGSHHGWGPWEVNPTGLLGGGATETAALVNLRYTGANPAGPLAPLDRFRGLSTGALNGWRMPPQYARIDASGTGTGAADPMTLPAVGGSYPFPSYSNRFAVQQSGAVAPQQDLNAQLAATHGQSFSPSQWSRRQTPTSGTPWMAGLEDQMRLALPSRMTKGTTGYNGQFAPNGRLTTHFSVSQRWGEMTVPTNNTGGTARVAAIDITRPLPDYRTNPAVVLSPANLGNAANALLARQNLARDIFVRVMAGLGQIDGTNVVYDPTTANVVIGYAAGTPQFNGLRAFAQYAVNMVDYLDGDDISTPFAWNAAVPTEYVFGTELPKLVLNEAYCGLFNNRLDLPMPPLAGVARPARQPHKVMFWVELHNPAAADPTLPDGGAARLQYDGTTQVPDQTGAAVAAPFGGSVYQVDIAEVTQAQAAATGTTPLTAALLANPSNVALDTTALAGANTRIRVQSYTYDATAPAPPATLMNDQLNLVQPAGGVSPGAAGGNAGYYVLGPRDNFPDPAVLASMRLPDDAAPGPHNAMMYSPNVAPLDNAGVTAQLAATHTVILRRLANPYLPAQPLPAMPGYNPYIVVDYLENLPTRDRAEFSSTDRRMGWMASTSPSAGRRHPFAAAPTYGAANAAVVDQTANPAPPMPLLPAHTFFAANNANNPANLDNQRGGGTVGLEWLAHLDREPVNVLELLTTGVQSPAKLTQTFFDGTAYQRHLAISPTGVPFPLDPAFGGFVRVLDLLGTASRLPGVPLGGRQPGLVNLNTAGDAAVLNAVLDPQSGNLFPAGYPAAAWNTAGVGLLPGRTPNPSALGGAYNQPSATVAEGGGGTDRPFQPAGALFADSLFRAATATPTAPMLFNYGAGTNGHPSTQSEPLRKGWNNLTTVSDGFLVVFTVGFFEWSPPGFPNSLGKELHKDVSGDLRAQFAGVIDRSAITQTVTPATLAVQATTLGPKPWETKLTADSPAGSNQLTVQATGTAGGTTCTVYDDGTAVTIQAGSALWVGHSSVANGGDGEAVRVTAVLASGAGTAVLTVETTVGGGTPLTRFHGGGGRVSNAPVGHPGPQTTFDYRDTSGRYRGVLPYFAPITP